MGPELKRKIEDALKAACLPDEAPTIRLDDTAANRVGGIVLSTVFENLDPAQRQDLIWQKLDAALSRHEQTLISFLLTETPDEYEVVRQYPTLDTVDPDAFARAVEHRVGALGKREDAKDLAPKARALAEYAKTGEGLPYADAPALAEEIAAAIGYCPVSAAAEDGYGIVLIGAQGRALLEQGKPIAGKELHVLATLVHGTREPLTTGADGKVSNVDAIAYLERRGIRL